jgi:PhnB protein
MILDSYLFFTGNCQEAMDFYKSVFGGELNVMPNQDGKGVMHALLSGGDIRLMASDGTRTEPYETSQISLSLSGNDADHITEVFNQLAEGGSVTAPLKVEVWGDTYGAVTDKFGIDWMVNIAAKKD